MTQTPGAERLVDIEMRNAHLERQLELLNAAVVEQGRAIDALVRQVDRLRLELERREAAAAASAPLVDGAIPRPPSQEEDLDAPDY
jgi:uncharacterized coiled-coil protein SlyX